MKKALLIILAAALLLSLAACGVMKKAGDDGKTLIYGSGDYTSINPALYEHGEINLLLFAGLTAHGANNELEPALAYSWDYDEDTLTYTFSLREGLKFHDGKPLTSADVKFTLEAIMNPDNGSEIASNYEEIASIETPDALTVVIRLSVPNVAMPDYLTIGILPKHLLDGQDITVADFNQHPVGAGPYKLVDWDMGQSITMEHFDDFYLGAPKIERVIFKIVEDESARALQMKSGELTLAQLSPKDAQEFDNKDGYVVHNMITADYRGILYNFWNPFWQENPGLPAAISFGIDRETIVQSVLLGHGVSAWSPLQMSEFVNTSIEKYEYNPAKAKTAIEALGWTIGSDGYYAKNGKQLAFAISVRPSDQVRVDMAGVAAQNLQDIGVNCTVELNPKTDWAGQEAFLIGWGSPFDPDDHTFKVFGTDQGANYSGYSNAEVDHILTAARSTSDKTERMEHYKAFQEVLAENPAYTFIAYIDALYVAKTELQLVQTPPILGHHGVGIFWNVYEWVLE